MKSIIFSFLLLAISTIANSQVTLLHNGSNEIFDLKTNGSQLFFHSTHLGFPNSSSIVKIDLHQNQFYTLDTIYHSSDWLSQGTFSRGIYVSNTTNSIYFSKYIPTGGSSSLYKISLSNFSISTSPLYINRLHVIDTSANSVIYGSSKENNNQLIYKINHPSTQKIILDTLNSKIDDLIIYDNKIFICRKDSNDILSLNLGKPNDSFKTFVNGLSGPTNFHLDGTDLFFTESTANQISKINLALSTPVVSPVIINLLNQPRTIAKIGDDIYFSDNNFNIMTFTYNPNSIIKFNQNTNFHLFPNPSINYLLLESEKQLTNEPYSIYSSKGELVLSGRINADQKVDLSSLFSKGIYFIKIDGSMVKFIKK
jgi:hypothetical protein